jgi:glycosyltransferase involved in cell wall biosynthesis
MPVLNGGIPFIAALESVLAQTYDNVELIVVDGGSTDGTVDFLRRNDAYIDVWLSERDAGVYDAMNKGVSLASGDYIAILNADDGYEPDALERTVMTMRQSSADFAFGTVIVRDMAGVPCLITGPLKRPEVEGEKPTGRMPFPHITMVVSRALYHSLGAYDSSAYRIAADYEFALRLLRSAARGVEIPGIFGWVTAGGMSDSVANLKEKRKILRRTGTNTLRAGILFASSLAKRGIRALLPASLLRHVLRWRGSRAQSWPAA